MIQLPYPASLAYFRPEDMSYRPGPGEPDGRARAILDVFLVLELEVAEEPRRQVGREVLALDKLLQLLQQLLVRLRHWVLLHHVVEQRAEDVALKPNRYDLPRARHWQLSKQPLLHAERPASAFMFKLPGLVEPRRIASRGRGSPFGDWAQCEPQQFGKADAACQKRCPRPGRAELLQTRKRCKSN